MRKRIIYCLFSSKRLFIAYLAIAPVSAALELGLAYNLSIAVDYAMNGQVSQVPIYAVAFIGYIIAELVISYFCKRIRFLIIGYAMSKMKNDLMAVILSMDYLSYKKDNTARYISELTVNAERIRESLFEPILRAYPMILQFLVAMAALIIMSPLMGIYVLGLTVVQLLIPILMGKGINMRSEMHVHAVNSETQVMKEAVESFDTIRYFDLKEKMINYYNKATDRTEKAWSSLKSYNSFSYELSFAVGNAIYLGIFLIGAIYVLKGILKLSEVIAAAQLMVYIATPLTTLTTDIAEIKSVSKVINSMKVLLDRKVQVEGKLNCTAVNTGISLNNVTFKYADKCIFNEVSFNFEKGKKYVIVGESGEGKSTLVKLLMRLIVPNAGEIYLDNQSVGDISTVDYAKLVSCVPQDPYLYNTSIRDNIALRNEVNSDLIWDVISKAGLKKFIGKNDLGLETILGEKANDISGGEAQRIALARALVKKPEILIVDEGTSHLDEKTAKEIESRIFDLKNTMVIFITHVLREDIEKKADAVIRICGEKLVSE